MTTPQEVLAQVPLFSMLSKKDVEGRAAVSVRGRTVRALGPGDYFGEMALIDHSYRSAKVTAETELRCLLFVAWIFRPFALEHPESAWGLLEMMVRRVREAEAR